MKRVRKLFESSRKIRKMFPAFREGGTVHAPKACTDAPLDTKGAAPSEKPPGPATESALRRPGLQRQGPTLRYDPSLTLGKRVGHPKRQKQIPRAGIRHGGTEKPQVSRPKAPRHLGYKMRKRPALRARCARRLSYFVSGARAERPGNLAAEPSSSSIRRS